MTPNPGPVNEVAGTVLAHLIQYSFFYAEAAVVAVAFRMSCRADGRGWPALERMVGALARRRGLAVAMVGMTALAGRLALAPVLPEREPFITDESSYLLAAKTFAAGRLTNPTHPMWAHFETMHVNHQPTYMSMYPPAQGLVLAAGERLTGHPIAGVWVSSALMCAAICWMLQGWMPPLWALLGGLIAVVRFGLFSYWANSYWGGAVAALGGALVLGALPRVMKRRRARDSVWLGLGAALLANSRPFEGAVLCLPVAVWLAAWIVREGRWRKASIWLRTVVPAAVVLVTVAAGMAYYNWRLTGDPMKLPYQVNRETYPGGRYFVWEAERPQASYRHASMRAYYLEWQDSRAEAAMKPLGFVKNGLMNSGFFWLFYMGPLFTIPFAALPSLRQDRRVRFLLVAAGAFWVGVALDLWFLAHYAAPAMALFLAIVVQCLRHMRCRRGRDGRRAGRWVWAIPAVCVLMALLRLAAQPMAGMLAPDHPATWYNTQAGDLDRARVKRQLQRVGGTHLVLVRYAPGHNWFDEWVYNEPDIDASRVVWAHDMGADANRELLEYFRGRRVWLMEPDAKPPRLSALE